MFNCFDGCTFFQLFVGCIASLAGWWVINVVFVPRLRFIDKEIQSDEIKKKSGKKGNNKDDVVVKKYVRIKNWTCSNAHDVLFISEFRNGNNKKDSYISRKRVPYIEKGDIYRLELPPSERHKNVDAFFNELNDNNTLVITAAFINRFGVKNMSRKVYRNK